jgi:hypothetical protein
MLHNTANLPMTGNGLNGLRRLHPSLTFVGNAASGY